MGFLHYMNKSIDKRFTIKHLLSVCLQSFNGQVKQLSLYSQVACSRRDGGMAVFLVGSAFFFDEVAFGGAVRRLLVDGVEYAASLSIRSCARRHGLFALI